MDECTSTPPTPTQAVVTTASADDVLLRDVAELGSLLEQLGLAQIALSNVLRLYFGSLQGMSAPAQVAVQRAQLSQVRSTIAAMVATGEACAMRVRQHAAAACGNMALSVLPPAGTLAN
jgi:hypothetical protein